MFLASKWDQPTMRRHIMNEQFSAERRSAGGSSLVRRLVQAQGDPVKRRARQWLVAMVDQQLLDFGLTPADIAVLRGAQPSHDADQRFFAGHVGSASGEEVAATGHRPARDASLIAAAA
jgi:hypothetical protein